MKKIGRLLKEEEERFIDYAEIERQTAELGFPVSVRTLRFYVDEGVLPAPNKVGKKPVYDKDWILNVLLAIHLMKARMNRSLKDIRSILGKLTEDPAILADKLSALYERHVRGGSLAPVQSDWLIEAFFDRLTGRVGDAVQPSALNLAQLAGLAEDAGAWDSKRASWTPPPRDKLARIGAAEARIRIRERGGPQIRVSLKEPEADEPEPEALRARALRRTNETVKRVSVRPVGEVEVVEDGTGGGAADEPASEENRYMSKASAEPDGPVPEGAVTLLEARSQEEFFLQRFELEFESMETIANPLTGKLLPVNSRTTSTLKRDHSAAIIQAMKSRQIYDRALLDAIPLEKAWEFHVYRRGFFGRGELNVVLAALSLAPIEEFLDRRYASTPLGSEVVRRAVSELVLQEGIFYYVGLFSSSGWTREARERVPQDKNLSCCLIEREDLAGWRVTGQGDDRWLGVSRLFDPETDQEKIERVKGVLRDSPRLRLKGGHVVLQNLVEDLGLSAALVDQAVRELVEEDRQLTVVTSAGYEIVKRARF